MVGDTAKMFHPLVKPQTQALARSQKYQLYQAHHHFMYVEVSSYTQEDQTVRGAPNDAGPDFQLHCAWRNFKLTVHSEACPRMNDFKFVL